MRSNFSINPLIQLNLPLKFRANTYLPPHLHIFNTHTRARKSRISCTGSDNSQNQEQQQQLNLSVLRFTLGIPGLDESNLPRWIGYTFGSLLLLNHLAGSDSNTITPAQLRTEALGLSLAAFSVVVPFLGKFLKGASSVDQAILPEGSEQLFLMSQNISDTIKEDLAWGTYILLRNTNTVSVLISAQDALCVRGYWNTPEGISKNDALDWFEKQIQLFGLSNLKDTLYFPQSTDSDLWKILPKETRSLLVQPVLLKEKAKGFLLLASSISYAYNNRDRAWVGAIANKYTAHQVIPAFKFRDVQIEKYLNFYKNFSTRFCTEENIFRDLFLSRAEAKIEVTNTKFANSTSLRRTTTLLTSVTRYDNFQRHNMNRLDKGASPGLEN